MSSFPIEIYRKTTGFSKLLVFFYSINLKGPSQPQPPQLAEKRISV